MHESWQHLLHPRARLSAMASSSWYWVRVTIQYYSVNWANAIIRKKIKGDILAKAENIKWDGFFCACY